MISILSFEELYPKSFGIDIAATLRMGESKQTSVLSSFFSFKGRPKPILIVDDDVELCDLLATSLKQELPGIELSFAHDPFDALERVMERQYRLIILDWNLQAMTASEMLSLAEREFELDPTLQGDLFNSRSPVVVLSVDPRQNCRLGKLEHFKQVGHINKNQKLNAVIHDLTGAIQR